MIKKDCINFKEIQSRIVCFPACELLESKIKPFEKIITDFTCEDCEDYKKKDKG
ncbi:MAG: hypothetical protein ACYDIA_01905 [Candidatus Humimicrobiaceae bacterium]